MAKITNMRGAAWALMGSAALLAAPALADVTPEEVWQNWQDIGNGMGQAIVAGKTTRDGDTLTISDVTIASAAGGVTAEGTLSQLQMQDLGNGTVKVLMSPDYAIKLRLPAPHTGTEETEMNIAVTKSDLVMTVSGTPAAMRYDLQAPVFSLELTRIEGVSAQAAGLTVSATASNVGGYYVANTLDGKISVDSDVTIDALALAATGSNARSKSDLNMTATLSKLAMTSSGALWGAMAGSGLPMQMLQGMDSASTLSAQSSTFDIEVIDDKGRNSITGTGGKMMVDSAISGGVMRYETAQKALSVQLNLPAVPLPDLAVSLEDVSFGMTMPLAANDAAQPFAFSTKLVNLAFSEQLWAMFDPSSQLPRDPINLVIDADGMAQVNETAGALPADLQSLNLKELRLGVAGAELTGSGASTFVAGDNGLPDPDAKIDLTLTGANALMDKVVAAGLIPPEALTFPRMMLAMVARPAGDDSYTSTIEIKDKSIFANGQKLHQME